MSIQRRVRQLGKVLPEQGCGTCRAQQDLTEADMCSSAGLSE